MNLVHIYKKITTSNLGLVIVLLLTATYSLVDAFQMHQKIESIIILWSLAVGMCAVTVWHRIKIKTIIHPHDIILSWIFLICAGAALLLTAFVSDSLAMRISLLLFMGACLARFANYQNVFKLLPAGVIFLLIIPNSAYFNSLISYPLRLICSHLTCFTLKLCAMDISCEATVLRMGAEKIAVTTACSGIVQLESMFLIGWIITMLVHKRLICQISHWLLLLPIVILVNSLRLTITLLLYSAFGEVAFSDTVHTSLGYAMVIAVTAIFWACRSLIPFSEKKEISEDKK